jgi:hypothetical protein
MEQEIDKLKKEIDKLKQEVVSERMVKQSEVKLNKEILLLNKESRFYVHKLKAERDALLKMNKEYLDKIGQLELLLEEL